MNDTNKVTQDKILAAETAVMSLSQDERSILFARVGFPLDVVSGNQPNWSKDYTPEERNAAGLKAGNFSGLNTTDGSELNTNNPVGGKNYRKF